MIRFLRKLNLWVIFFTLLAYIAPYVSPVQMSFLMFVGVTYPWLLIINLIFISIWALSFLRYWWYSAAVILVGWTYLSTVFGTHYDLSAIFGNKKLENVSPPTNAVKILTYNVHGGISPTIKNNKKTRSELSHFIEEQSPDVLCLQEFLVQWGDMYDNIMLEDIPVLKTYPYWTRIKGNGIAIFSRFPIKESDILLNQPQEIANGCTYADIEVKNKMIRFYSVQLTSNVVSDIADELIHKKDITDDDSWFSLGRILTRFRRYSIIRAREAESLKKHIQESPYPVVICGDFNDIPVSYTYQTISDGLTDAFQATGRGIGTTYAGHIPALRIDYILSDNHLKPLSCFLSKEPYSDHYPVVSIIDMGR